MALGYVATLRNNQLDQIGPLVEAGAAAGTLKLYTGTRPATGGAVTTLVATLTFTDPAPFNAATGGSVTAKTISDDTSAVGNASPVTWFRVADSNGNAVIDGDVGTSGSDLNLNSTTIAAGSTVSVTSFTISAGNP